MKFSVVAVVTAMLCLLAGASVAAAGPRAASTASAPRAAGSAPAAGAKGPAQPRPVDINSASRSELMKLPGVSAADADRIIAGRPYLSKAHLVTRGVIAAGTYQQIRTVIMARQKGTPRP